MGRTSAWRTYAAAGLLLSASVVELGCKEASRGPSGAVNTGNGGAGATAGSGPGAGGNPGDAGGSPVGSGGGGGATSVGFCDTGLRLGETAPNSGVYWSTFDVAVGDLDGDGWDDYVAGNNVTHPNRVYLSNGTGDFEIAAELDLSGSGDPNDNNTHAVVLADFDNLDGPDLIVGNNFRSNRVYLNQGSSADVWEGFALDPNSVDGSAPADCSSNQASDACDTTWALASADLDGKNGPDLIVGNKSNLSNRILLNNGVSGGAWLGFSVTAQPLGTMDVVALATGDLNGDGCVDVVSGGDQDADMVWLNGKDAGGCTAVFNGAPIIGSGPTLGLALADLDGDDVLDLVTGTGYSQTAGALTANQVFLGDGAGNFSLAIEFGSPSLTEAVITVDANADGLLDVVVGNLYALDNSGGVTELWLNGATDNSNEWPGLELAQSFPPRDTRALALIDFDGQGGLDLLEANHAENEGGEPDILWQQPCAPR